MLLERACPRQTLHCTALMERVTKINCKFQQKVIPRIGTKIEVSAVDFHLHTLHDSRSQWHYC